METERIEKLLAVVLLELVATRNACVRIEGLLRGSPLQRGDELEEAISSLGKLDLRTRHDRLVMTLKEAGLQDALEWALVQELREESGRDSG